MPALDASGLYTVHVETGSTHSYFVTDTLRRALRYAVDQFMTNRIHVSIFDRSGQRFDDPQLWQEFVDEWKQHHPNAPKVQEDMFGDHTIRAW